MLLRQAFDRLGSFYRVHDPTEGEVAHRARYVDDRTVSVRTETQVGATQFAVDMALEPFPASSASRSTHTVDIYLDGALLRTIDWKQNADGWELDVKVTDGPYLRVSANATFPPVEFQLIKSELPPGTGVEGEVLARPAVTRD